MKSPCPYPRVAWLLAAAALMVVPPTTAALVTGNPIGSLADGQSILLDIDQAPGYRFSLTETTQIGSIDVMLGQSTGAFAVAFLRIFPDAANTSIPNPGSWIVTELHPMLMNPADVVIFDPQELSGPTLVTIPYDTVLPSGDYVLTFNITSPDSSHTFLAYDPTPGSEGMKWVPNWNVQHTAYGSVTWSDTTLQPDIRINSTIPEPSTALLLPAFAVLLIHRRNRRFE